MTTVTKFGKFFCEKGATDDPRDFWVDFSMFEFDDEEADPIDKVLAVLDYIKGHLVASFHST